MNHLKAPSLNSLLESERGSTDSLLAESLQLEVEDLDDVEYSIPPTATLPTLETVLSEFEIDSDIGSEVGVPPPTLTPTPSIAEDVAGVRSGGAGGSGSIMRYNMLQGVSAQISSAADRINAGLASACAVSAFIAIGTSHGHILNFDVTQTLRWAHQDKHAQGSVSALAFNADSTRLLAGYARGLVVMLDTQTGDALRQLFDAVAPNTGVLHVKWTSRPALALCADSGGSVWSLTFTRKLGIRSCASRCLFSGARGEVCAVEPLIMNGNGQQHELEQYCIVALATLSKYFIVTVRPRLKVVKYHTLQGPADFLPVLAWQMVLIQAVDTTRSVDPVIVVGRGNQLFFHQLFMSNGRITLLYLRHVTLQANLLSVHWLGPKCVGCLDAAEILHLIDVRSSRELECIDMADAGLVYGSAQFKGLATGGNVSPALALAGSHACYASLAAQGAQLYILGARSLHMIGVRSWSERIGYLVRHQRWQEACDLALDGYRAAAERPKRRAQAKERILMLFREYLAACTHAPDYCLSAIMKCLVAINELELLWTELWDRMHYSTDLFLKHLSEHIENEQIRAVNPAISQALVDYWLQRSPAKLEELILKLDWTYLDLNQVLKAVKTHKLYKAQMYLNTRAFNDYTLSLFELIPLLNVADNAAHPTNTELGNCLLVYISSCLAGRGYPSGDIAEELVPNVKHDVLRLLTSLHSIKNEADEPPYPYLRTLLKFDTRETLNVISLAFQEKEFSGELGYLQRKRIVTILLEIMTPENETWAEIGCLLNFIAQQISLQCLPHDDQLLRTILNYLAADQIANESARQHAERESAWQELLANNCLIKISNDEAQLELARKAKCHYVTEYLLEKLQRYGTILECYLGNPQRHDTMFAYIERHAEEPQRQIYDQVKQHLRQLIEINAAETTRIVNFYFSGVLDELLEKLRGGGGGNGNDDDDDQAQQLYFVFLHNLYRRRAKLAPFYYDELLELLCQRQPTEVDEFLRCGVTADAATLYNPTKALEICKRHRMTAATIYLYEKQTNYRAAFELGMAALADAVGDAENLTHWSNEVSGLCVRASLQLQTTNEREPFWFEFLSFILQRVDLQSITKSMLHEASQHCDLSNLVQLVLNTRNVSGNFGDIKELLMSMLTQSRLEQQSMEAAALVLAQDLHEQFAKRQRDARRGLWVTAMRCALCQNRLYNQHSILVLGKCGHALHNQCALELQLRSGGMHLNEVAAAAASPNGDAANDDGDDDESNLASLIGVACPRCQTEYAANCLKQPLNLAQPTNGSYGAVAAAAAETAQFVHQLGLLRVKAPPRRL